VQPHKVMRSLGFTKTGEDFWSQYAALCCACGLCTLYACPENLFPKEACDSSKAHMKEQQIHWSGPLDIVPHPMQSGRRTPLKLLMKKLGVTDYDVPSHFQQRTQAVRAVRLPLQQHIGQPARPVVSQGQVVRAGEPVGEIPPGQLGARLHASIDGVVREVSTDIVIEDA
jgi:Na+-translocating ferredoxin:NAD+ oxidoreductase RnfC subunit